MLHAIGVAKVQTGYGLNEGNHHRYNISEHGITLPAYVWKVDRVVDCVPLNEKWSQRWGCKNEQGDDHRSSLLEKLQDPQERQWIGRLLLDILRHLHTIQEDALADSLCQSIKIDTMDTKEDHDYWLPDSAAELLANEDLCANMWLALQLDNAFDGNVGQFWIIDRITRAGNVWVGNYTLPFQPEVSQSPSLPISKIATSEEPSEEQSQTGSILQSQLTRQILAMKAHEVTAADPYRKPEDVTITVAAFLTLAALSSKDTIQKDKRLAARVSAFDVDGPCLVATPFDAEIERLPRPSIRAMSSAWVVEMAGNVEGMTANFRESAAMSGKQFKVLGRVKGCCEIMEQTIHAYTFV